jgi:hypothetical protein
MTKCRGCSWEDALRGDCSAVMDEIGDRGLARAYRTAWSFTLLVALSVLVLTHYPSAYGQQMEPRSYANAPIGLNFFIAGYVHEEGGVLLDPSVPVTDLNAKIDLGVLGYSRVLDLWGQSGTIALVLPYGSIAASGKIDEQSKGVTRSGFGDPALRLSVNLYGAPALSLQDFRDYRQDTIVGVTFLVTAPWGRYDSTKLVNLGTNRWSFKPEVGLSKGLGNWVLEAAAGVTFFTANDEYLGANTREQAALYAVQGHAIYNFDPRTWASIDATFYAGGRSSLNGVESDDRQQNSRWGITFSRSLDLRNSLKLYYSNGATVRAGANFSIVGVAWQYRWGAGL